MSADLDFSGSPADRAGVVAEAFLSALDEYAGQMHAVEKGNMFAAVIVGASERLHDHCALCGGEEEP